VNNLKKAVSSNEQTKTLDTWQKYLVMPQSKKLINTKNNTNNAHLIFSASHFNTT